jgi:hypothetical protein
MSIAESQKRASETLNGKADQAEGLLRLWDTAKGMPEAEDEAGGLLRLWFLRMNGCSSHGR